MTSSIKSRYIFFRILILWQSHIVADILYLSFENTFHSAHCCLCLQISVSHTLAHFHSTVEKTKREFNSTWHFQWLKMNTDTSYFKTFFIQFLLNFDALPFREITVEPPNSGVLQKYSTIAGFSTILQVQQFKSTKLVNQKMSTFAGFSNISTIERF